MRRVLLVAVALLLATPACFDKETGKGADTKAGEGARAGAPIGENKMPDGGSGAAGQYGGPTPRATTAAAGTDGGAR